MCLIENFLLNLQVYKILSYFILLTKKHSITELCLVQFQNQDSFQYTVGFTFSLCPSSLYIWLLLAYSENLIEEKGIFLPEVC